MKICKKHGEVKLYSNGKCGKCNAESVGRRRIKIKQKCIDYKGGSCSICGYNKCTSALEFHHINPSEKDFSDFARTISWDRIKPELDKTVLLCANCHRETHEKIRLSN